MFLRNSLLKFSNENRYACLMIARKLSNLILSSSSNIIKYQNVIINLNYLNLIFSLHRSFSNSNEVRTHRVMKTSNYLVLIGNNHTLFQINTS